MTDRAARIRELIDELDRLGDERAASIQRFERLTTPLREELDTLRFEVYLEQSGDARLQPGDQLLVTEAFWREKRLRGVDQNFNLGDLWDAGRPAVVERLNPFLLDAADSAGALGVTVIIKGVEGAGTTGVGYDTALDMRQAWLAANA